MNNNNKVNPFIEVDINFEKGECLLPITEKVVEGVKPYYYVSNKGNIYSTYNNKFKKLKPVNEKINDDSSYKLIDISYTDKDGNSKTKKVRVHRAVALEFMPEGQDIENNITVIDHIDCNKANNNLENLEWVTQSENVARAKLNGLMYRPLQNKKEILDGIVNDLQSNKFTILEIANKYNVTTATVYRIKTGSYEDIVGSNIEFTFKQPLTDEQLKDIYIRSFTDEDWQKIADEYNISWYTVKQIHYPNANRFGDRIRDMGFDNISVADNLTKDQIIEIRKKCDMGVSDEVLAKEYNRSTRTISMIRKGRDRFKETLENAGFVSDDPERELNDGEMLQIYEMAKNGISDKEIAKKFNIHQTMVITVRTGSKYKQADFLKRYNLPKIMRHNRKVVKENRFSEEEAIAIYNKMKETKKYTRQMAAKYGCDKSLMANIKYCRGSYYYLQEKYGLEPLNY